MDNTKEFKDIFFEPSSRVYKFIQSHFPPKTDDDWRKMIDGMEQFKTPLEADLLNAYLNEVERTYKAGDRYD